MSSYKLLTDPYAAWQDESGQNSDCIERERNEDAVCDQSATDVVRHGKLPVYPPKQKPPLADADGNEQGEKNDGGEFAVLFEPGDAGEEGEPCQRSGGDTNNCPGCSSFKRRWKFGRGGFGREEGRGLSGCCYAAEETRFDDPAAESGIAQELGNGEIRKPNGGSPSWHGEILHVKEVRRKRKDAARGGILIPKPGRD